MCGCVGVGMFKCVFLAVSADVNMGVDLGSLLILASVTGRLLHTHLMTRNICRCCILLAGSSIW